ncbi:hypothetical protein D3C71_1606760 [compost metagenome]
MLGPRRLKASGKMIWPASLAPITTRWVSLSSKATPMTWPPSSSSAEKAIACSWRPSRRAPMVENTDAVRVPAPSDAPTEASGGRTVGVLPSRVM